MPRVYGVPVDNLAVTNANGDYELVELLAADDKPIEVCGWDFGQLTEVQEAQEEQLRLAVVRGYTTAGTGGGTVTPTDLNLCGVAAGFTAATGRTALGTGGTTTVLWPFAMQVRSGHQWGPVPEGYGFVTSGTLYLSLRLQAAVTDDLQFHGVVMVRESG